MINTIKKCATTYTMVGRGKAKLKHYWGIDMNESRSIYLGTYSSIDSIYYHVQNGHMKYRSCNKWNSSMLQVMVMAVFVSCYIHLGCTEGELAPSLEYESPSDLYKFSDVL